jgi:hypothetical protein
LSHEEIENLNEPIVSNEIEAVTKRLPSRESQNHMALQLSSIKHLKNKY